MHSTLSLSGTKQLNVRLSEDLFFYVKETSMKKRKSMQAFIQDLILENFARQNGIENPTQEEIAAIESTRLYLVERPHLSENISREELTHIAKKVRTGESLADLLGYTEND